MQGSCKSSDGGVYRMSDKVADEFIKCRDGGIIGEVFYLKGKY